jgi:hypothetical protein
MRCLYVILFLLSMFLIQVTVPLYLSLFLIPRYLAYHAFFSGIAFSTLRICPDHLDCEFYFSSLTSKFILISWLLIVSVHDTLKKLKVSSPK